MADAVTNFVVSFVANFVDSGPDKTRDKAHDKVGARGWRGTGPRGPQTPSAGTVGLSLSEIKTGTPGVRLLVISGWLSR